MSAATKTKRFEYEKYGSLFALAVLFLISSIASPYFLQLQNLLNILRQVSYTGMIGLGMTFVIISGGIDLSVGSMVAFVGGVSILGLNYFVTAFAGIAGGEIWAIVLTILVGILVGAGAGALNGFVIPKGKVHPFIVPLGTMAIFRSLTLYLGNAGEF